MPEAPDAVVVSWLRRGYAAGRSASRSNSATTSCGVAEFDVPSLQVWSLHDGKVSRMRYLIDTAKLLRAIEGDPVS